MRAGFTERQLLRHEIRHRAVKDRLERSGAESVLDLGCGDGQLLEMLAKGEQFRRLTGVDVVADHIRVAEEHLAPLARNSLEVAFFVGSILDIAEQIPPHKAVTLVEVIEHLEPPEMSAVEELIFDALRPEVTVFTTPAKAMGGHAAAQHGHHFEWTPPEAVEWATGIARQYGYVAEHSVLSTAPLPGLDIQVISFERSK